MDEFVKEPFMYSLTSLLIHFTAQYIPVDVQFVNGISFLDVVDYYAFLFDDTNTCSIHWNPELMRFNLTRGGEWSLEELLRQVGRWMEHKYPHLNVAQLQWSDVLPLAQEWDRDIVGRAYAFVPPSLDAQLECKELYQGMDVSDMERLLTCPIREIDTAEPTSPCCTLDEICTPPPPAKRQRI